MIYKFGQQVCLPVDLMYGTTPTSQQSFSEYAVTLQIQLTAAYDGNCLRPNMKGKRKYMIGKIMEIHTLLMPYWKSLYSIMASLKDDGVNQNLFIAVIWLNLNTTGKTRKY